MFFQTAAGKNPTTVSSQTIKIHSLPVIANNEDPKRKKRWQTQRLIKKKKSCTMDTWIVSLEASCVAAEMPRKYV